MKALCLKSYGQNLAENVTFLERTLTAVNDCEVLIDIHFAGLNPIDYKIINGMAKLFMNPPKPFGLGFDLSGKVVQIGENVQDFKVGDEVYTKLPWTHIGSIGQQAICPMDMLSQKPKNISHEEAAGLPLVACTVLDSFELMQIKKGTKILIHAGSGGIGTFAIQYAKHLGAIVYTTTSTANIKLVKSIGADFVIDYTKENYLKMMSEIDIVYDTLGGKFTKEATEILKRGGQIISIAGFHDKETLKSIGIHPVLRFLNNLKGISLMKACKKKNIQYKHVWSFPNKIKLDIVSELIEKNHIKAITDRVFNFEDSIKALEYVSTQRAKGKVLIDIRNSQKA